MNININTWKCHICGEDRDDEFISVYSKDISDDIGLIKGSIKQNVRYCNDKIECKNKVTSFNFIKKEE